jgi:Domain of unknown function (DUF397)
VEVAKLTSEGIIAVRDSKNTTRDDMLVCSRTNWDSFLSDIRDGGFDIS